MPLRPFRRNQAWLLPPTLDNFLADDHPARFVAEFLDQLDPVLLWELEGNPLGDPMGQPAYHPHALLNVWVYGFMMGVRSCRKLEGACRDQIPFLWLSGNQRPDHNTLWRYYVAHREDMRWLLQQSVRVAVRAGLVELALQAVDGTKIAGNASPDRTYSAAEMERLLKRTEGAIEDLEAQNATGGDPPPPRLPEDLAEQNALRERVRAALKQIEEEGLKYRNLTDGDAHLLKSHRGYVTGYNAQAMVSPVVLDTGQGLLITAADVVSEGDDHPQLQPMMAQAAENTQRPGEVTTLADAGYYSASNLLASEGQEVLVPSPQEGKGKRNPYHKDHFVYEQAADSYRCPQGQALPFVGMEWHPQGYRRRVYQGEGEICRGCPAFGQCTRDPRGRRLRVGEYEPVHQRHRQMMQREAARACYGRRKELVEPVFGIIKEQQGGRRFLLRSLAKVRAEWSLLAVGFNLKSLWRAWKAQFLGWQGMPLNSQVL